MSDNPSSNKPQQTTETGSFRKYESKMKIDSIEEIKEADKTKLQQAYTIWVMMKQNKNQMEEQSYENVLKLAATFNTIEDFWAIYQHFKRPTQMTFGTFLHVFIDGVKPMWEDEHCKDGGRWSIRVPKTHTNKYWEDLLLGMIGEQFRVENEILGIAISLRPNQDTISLWLRSGKDKEKIESIKEDIEKLIKIEEGMKLEFENFTESLQQKQERKYEKPDYHQQEGKGGNEGDNWQMRGGRGRGRGRGGYNESGGHYNQE